MTNKEKTFQNLHETIIKSISAERKGKYKEEGKLSVDDIHWYIIQRMDNLHNIVFELSIAIENILEKKIDRFGELKKDNESNLKKLRELTKKLPKTPLSETPFIKVSKIKK